MQGSTYLVLKTGNQLRFVLIFLCVRPIFDHDLQGSFFVFIFPSLRSHLVHWSVPRNSIVKSFFYLTICKQIISLKHIYMSIYDLRKLRWKLRAKSFLGVSPKVLCVTFCILTLSRVETIKIQREGVRGRFQLLVPLYLKSIISPPLTLISCSSIPGHQSFSCAKYIWMYIITYCILSRIDRVPLLS